MSYMLNPRILLLKEGTDDSQGIGQLISNINACCAVVDIVKTTLGPCGMDKLINNGTKAVISNDGATIINLLDIVHPAASTLVDIAKAQDEMVGDGTTTVVVLAGELLRNIRGLLEEGMHPMIVIHGFKKAKDLACKRIMELAQKITPGETEEKQLRAMLMSCAKTTLQSKLISQHKDFFSEIAVDAVLSLDKQRDLKMVGIKNVSGGSVTDSFMVEGVAFKKTFSYAGFEQQPKYFKNPKIVLINVELELKSEGANAEIRIEDPTQYQSIVDAEWKIIYDKLGAIYESGAKVVLSQLPIGDLATQWFADRDVFCAGRVAKGDLVRMTKATGAKIQTSLGDLSPSVLGTCGTFEEKQVGSERFNIFSGCPTAKTVTVVLRGGAEQFIDETQRSFWDALMIVKRTVEHSSTVGGGGAIEMELSKYLREYSKQLPTKEQLVVASFAQSLEVIPRQLAENAGFNSTDILNKLRAAHYNGSTWAGVDILNDDICDTFKNFVWEPAMNKLNALSSATEAATVILSIDETVKNPKSQGLDDQRMAPVPGRR